MFAKLKSFFTGDKTPKPVETQQPALLATTKKTTASAPALEYNSLNTAVPNPQYPPVVNQTFTLINTEAPVVKVKQLVFTIKGPVNPKGIVVNCPGSGTPNITTQVVNGNTQYTCVFPQPVSIQQGQPCTFNLQAQTGPTGILYPVENVQCTLDNNAVVKPALTAACRENCVDPTPGKVTGVVVDSMAVLGNQFTLEMLPKNYLNGFSLQNMVLFDPVSGGIAYGDLANANYFIPQMLQIKQRAEWVKTSFVFGAARNTAADVAALVKNGPAFKNLVGSLAGFKNNTGISQLDFYFYDLSNDNMPSVIEFMRAIKAVHGNQFEIRFFLPPDVAIIKSFSTTQKEELNKVIDVLAIAPLHFNGGGPWAVGRPAGAIVPYENDPKYGFIAGNTYKAMEEALKEAFKEVPGNKTVFGFPNNGNSVKVPNGEFGAKVTADGTDILDMDFIKSLPANCKVNHNATAVTKNTVVECKQNNTLLSAPSVPLIESVITSETKGGVMVYSAPSSNHELLKAIRQTNQPVVPPALSSSSGQVYSSSSTGNANNGTESSSSWTDGDTAREVSEYIGIYLAIAFAVPILYRVGLRTPGIKNYLWPLEDKKASNDEKQEQPKPAKADTPLLSGSSAISITMKDPDSEENEQEEELEQFNEKEAKPELIPTPPSTLQNILAKLPSLPRPLQPVKDEIGRLLGCGWYLSKYLGWSYIKNPVPIVLLISIPGSSNIVYAVLTSGMLFFMTASMLTNYLEDLNATNAVFEIFGKARNNMGRFLVNMGWASTSALVQSLVVGENVTDPALKVLFPPLNWVGTAALFVFLADEVIKQGIDFVKFRSKYYKDEFPRWLSRTFPKYFWGHDGPVPLLSSAFVVRDELIEVIGAIVKKLERDGDVSSLKEFQFLKDLDLNQHISLNELEKVYAAAEFLEKTEGGIPGRLSFAIRAYAQLVGLGAMFTVDGYAIEAAGGLSFLDRTSQLVVARIFNLLLYSLSYLGLSSASISVYSYFADMLHYGPRAPYVVRLMGKAVGGLLLAPVLIMGLCSGAAGTGLIREHWELDDWRENSSHAFALAVCWALVGISNAVFASKAFKTTAINAIKALAGYEKSTAAEGLQLNNVVSLFNGMKGDIAEKLHAEMEQFVAEVMVNIDGKANSATPTTARTTPTEISSPSSSTDLEPSDSFAMFDEWREEKRPPADVNGHENNSSRSSSPVLQENGSQHPILELLRTPEAKEAYVHLLSDLIVNEKIQLVDPLAPVQDVKNEDDEEIDLISTESESERVEVPVRPDLPQANPSVIWRQIQALIPQKKVVEFFNNIETVTQCSKMLDKLIGKLPHQKEEIQALKTVINGRIVTISCLQGKQVDRSAENKASYVSLGFDSRPSFWSRLNCCKKGNGSPQEEKPDAREEVDRDAYASIERIGNGDERRLSL